MSLVGQRLLIAEVWRSHSDKHTLVRTRPHKWSTRGRDLYKTTNNIYKRETPIPSAGFEPVTPASERPQFHGIGRDKRMIFIWLS